MTDKAPHILIFDSGVGGLSILDVAQEKFPHCRFSYCSDNAMFPYGTKDEDRLITRVKAVLMSLQQSITPDIIVIACNTASTITLPTLRKVFSTPIIGVVPAIKPATLQSRSKVIGLLATPGTVNRHYTLQLITEFAADCEVVAIGSSELVELAEQKLRGDHFQPEVLYPIVKPFIEKPNLDTVVLACTHFTLIKPELQFTLPSVDHWVDSGEAIARRIGFFLEKQGMPLTGDKISRHLAYFTADTAECRQLELKSTLSHYNLLDTVIHKVN